MKLNLFNNPQKKFSIVIFLQPKDLEEKKGEIEQLGKQGNVKLVVQPCPYEGIEFLYRIPVDLPGHRVSIDKEVFWQSIEVQGDIPADQFSELSKHHCEYLVAIVEQDVPKMMRERKVVESLARKFI